jgi:hypothetical protein
MDRGRSDHADRGAAGGRSDRRPRGTAGTTGIGISPAQPAARLHHRGAGARERGAADDGDPDLGPPQWNGPVTQPWTRPARFRELLVRPKHTARRRGPSVIRLDRVGAAARWGGMRARARRSRSHLESRTATICPAGRPPRSCNPLPGSNRARPAEDHRCGRCLLRPRP